MPESNGRFVEVGPGFHRCARAGCVLSVTDLGDSWIWRVVFPDHSQVGGRARSKVMAMGAANRLLESVQDADLECKRRFVAECEASL